MGKRDLASFLVILAFSVSLAATSKPKEDEEHRKNNHDAGFTTAELDAGDAGAHADNRDAAADATVVTKRELPDTSTWKPFAYAPGKLTGKTPPNLEVACTMAAQTTMCVLTQPKVKRTVAVFTTGGLDAYSASQALKADPTTKAFLIYDEGNDMAALRDESERLPTCDFVASSPAGLTAITHTQMKRLREEGFDFMAGIEPSECLDAIAFAHALQKTP